MMDDLQERTIEGAGGEASSSLRTGAEAPSFAGTAESSSSASGWTTTPGSSAGGPGPATGMPPGYTSYRGYAPGVPRPTGLPSPGLAALLGLIPGVGAMYNGQFAKGLAHLAIFAVLVSLADNVNGIFGVFVAGWVFYQAFEAYHTARARREGLPLPNAFGLNDIGERLGFGKNWPYNAESTPTNTNASGGAVPTASATPTGPAPIWSQGQPYVPPVAAYQATAYTPPPADPGANWAGYVPPTAFAQAPPPSNFYAGAAVPPPATPQEAAPNWSSVPFTPTAAGPAGNVAAANPASPVSLNRRFPVGAVLLIVLGGLFLLSNVAPAWRLSERWLLPLLLAAGGVWALIHRLGLSSRGPRPSLHRGNLVCALRLPAILFVLAILFSFQAAGWLTLGQTWPLLLIVLGVLLLLERTLGRRMPGSVTAPGFAQGVTPSGDSVESGVR